MWKLILLFIVLSPGVLFTLPSKGKKLVIACVHAAIFVLIARWLGVSEGFQSISGSSNTANLQAKIALLKNQITTLMLTINQDNTKLNLLNTQLMDTQKALNLAMNPSAASAGTQCPAGQVSKPADFVQSMMGNKYMCVPAVATVPTQPISGGSSSAQLIRPAYGSYRL